MNVRFAEPCRERSLELAGVEESIRFEHVNDGCTTKDRQLNCDQDIYIGVFFDGTNNNKYRDTPNFSHTNVARLYECYPGTNAAQTPPTFLPRVNEDGSKTERQVFVDRPFPAASVPAHELPYYRKVYVLGLGTCFPDVGDSGTGLQKKGGLGTGLLCQRRASKQASARFGLLGPFDQDGALWWPAGKGSGGMKNSATLRSTLSAAALAFASVAQASVPASSNWRTDCVGYHTLQVPGDVEYAVQRPPFNRSWDPAFSDGLRTSDNAYLHIDEGDAVRGGSVLALRVTAPTDAAGFEAVMDSKNAEQQKQKEDLLRQAALFADKEAMGKMLLQQARDLPFFEPVPDRAAFWLPSLAFGSTTERSGLTDLQILIGGRVVSVTRNSLGTPQQTVDAFLKQYKPREPFEVPTGPGACFPYATVTGEPRPSVVGMSIRLKDRPDIVVYLRDSDVDTSHPESDPREVLAKEIRLRIPDAKDAIASNKMRPIHGVTLADQEGVGAYVTIFRHADEGPADPQKKGKPAEDWGYVAYSPGDRSAPLGTSSELVLKVLRYGRYAKQPMTEREFHKLAETIAASIKRRPGAWVPSK